MQPQFFVDVVIVNVQFQLGFVLMKNFREILLHFYRLILFLSS